MNNKLIIIILVSVFFGLGGGIVGQIISRAYLVDGAFNIPMIGDINIRDSAINGKNLVISNPSKVVIEQNDKVLETANSVKPGIVGIFKKIASSTPSKISTDINNFDLSNYYKVDNALGQGFVVTSDGWIISSFLPKEMDIDTEIATSTLKNIINDYVIITKDKKIFNVVNIVTDKKQNHAFWKVDAKDLPVRVFVTRDDIDNGQMVMAMNWDESILISTILSKSDKDKKIIKSSEDYFKKITLSTSLNPSFNGSFIFDLSGNLLGFVDNSGTVGSISNYISCINCLLEKGLIKRPYFGVNYIDLSSLVKLPSEKYPENGALITPDEKGVAVKKSSPAEILKLKKGDIIISVNNINIDKNNQLNDLISGYAPGEAIDIIYLRNDNKETASITLGELN